MLNSKKIQLRSNVFHWFTGFTLDYQMVWDECIGDFKERKLIVQEVLNSADCKIPLTPDTLTCIKLGVPLCYMLFSQH